jgi:hypothetical protein
VNGKLQFEVCRSYKDLIKTLVGHRLYGTNRKYNLLAGLVRSRAWLSLVCVPAGLC